MAEQANNAEQTPQPDQKKLLSPDNSPNTMEIKKSKARRLGNKPVLLAFIVVGVIVFVLGWVMVGRGNKARADVAQLPQKSRVATANARDVMNDMGIGGGLFNPPPPELPEKAKAEPETGSETAPPSEKKELQPPAGIVPDKRIPEAPRLTEDAKKIRDRQFRQMEAVLDGPIQVRLDETKLQSRGIDNEMERLERQIAVLNSQDGQSYEQRLAAIKVATEGGGGATDYSTRGDLSRMKQFTGEKNWTNPMSVEAPPTMHIIRTGSVIPATLVGGINSDLPGQIIGQVSQNVYDTPTGKRLLIPQGSRLVGEYSSQVQYGQSRVFAVWQRLIFPDGKSLDLGEMPGSAGAGYAGFRDRVNNHYVRIFGSAIMMSAILAGVEVTQDDSSSNSDKTRMSDALSEALGNQLGGVMAEMLQKNMNIAPTLEIRPGYRFNVMLVKDLVFSGPYQAFDYTAR